MVDIRREISRRGAFGGHHERFATVKLNEAMQGCHHMSKLKESSVLFRISGGRASTRNMVRRIPARVQLCSICSL